MYREAEASPSGWRVESAASEREFAAAIMAAGTVLCVTTQRRSLHRDIPASGIRSIAAATARGRAPTMPSGNQSCATATRSRTLSLAIAAGGSRGSNEPARQSQIPVVDSRRAARECWVDGHDYCGHPIYPTASSWPADVKSNERHKVAENGLSR